MRAWGQQRGHRGLYLLQAAAQQVQRSLARCLRSAVHAEGLGRRQQAAERVVDLVRHRRGDATHRCHALGRQGAPLRLLALLQFRNQPLNRRADAPEFGVFGARQLAAKLRRIEPADALDDMRDEQHRRSHAPANPPARRQQQKGGHADADQRRLREGRPVRSKHRRIDLDVGEPQRLPVLAADRFEQRDRAVRAIDAQSLRDRAGRRQHLATDRLAQQGSGSLKQLRCGTREDAALAVQDGGAGLARHGTRQEGRCVAQKREHAPSVIGSQQRQGLRAQQLGRTVDRRQRVSSRGAGEDLGRYGRDEQRGQHDGQRQPQRYLHAVRQTRQHYAATPEPGTLRASCRIESKMFG